MVMVVVMMMVMMVMAMPVRWGDNAVIAVVMVMMMVVVMARVILRDLFSASRLCRSDAGIIDSSTHLVHPEPAPGGRDNWSVACFA